MKVTLNTLLCFLLIALPFFGCQKGSPDSYNTYTLAPEKTPITPTINDNDVADIKTAIVDHTSFLASLLAQTAMIITAHPALNDLSGNVLETRACPDAVPVRADHGWTVGSLRAPSDIAFDPFSPRHRLHHHGART